MHVCMYVHVDVCIMYICRVSMIQTNQSVGFRMNNMNLIARCHVKLTFVWNPWNHNKVTTVVLLVALCLKNGRTSKAQTHIRRIPKKRCSATHMLCHESHFPKVRANRAHTCGSILHASRPFWEPYSLWNVFFQGPGQHQVMIYICIYIYIYIYILLSVRLGSAILFEWASGRYTFDFYTHLVTYVK